MPRQLKTARRRKRKFQDGEKVTVFRVSETGRPYIEGRATIIGTEDGPFYRVRFDGERRERERLVHPGDWQSNPERLLAELHAQWLLSLTPELLTEFFPDDIGEREARS